MENKNKANESSSLERNELHNTIWKVANELRGSVDGWDFKQYVLGILFYRYISENMTHYINKEERKRDPSFDYASLSDEEAERAREHLIEEKGFFIPPSALFCNALKNAPSNEDLNVTLQNIFNEIEKSSLGTPSEENVKGLFADLDVNSNKLGSSHKIRVEKLAKILQAIGGMQLGDYLKSGIDVFGDAYEYLMAILAFTMHMLSYLSNQGTAAIVEFPGVLYRGNAEAKIREYLVKENVIDCVIALPENLFFGTNIATCILVLKKNKKDDTTLFIDASKEFVKEGKKNKLKAHNREKILQIYIERKAIKHFCALANIEKIQENDYNLSVNRYVEQEDTKEIIDIKTLNAEISQIVEKQSALRNRLESIIKELEA
ncbi:type I restriction-modification system subunit M [Helicobacter pylori]|uniref:type I restriction-modification system subunit M n=1 Tax=Helicobacter pylori TaxID=210 RepID=UPI000FDE2BA4|nr:type I restriction-modification system subunit M [Helicobacter pylori]RVY09159.1 type I restriction-modification system subunit M [Helicobacter pylori]